MRLKIIYLSFKFCTVIHLSVFIAAIAWYIPSSSLACVLDQLIETFEFIFSPLPLKNFYMLSDPAAAAITLQLIATFVITAIPSYAIGYPLCRHYFNKQP
jgi:hypothetical protein